jgi:hypothetical protein
MKILGLQGMTGSELNSELQRGGKFVSYQYCISAIAVSFKRSSSVYFVRAGESNVGKMAGYLAISLLLGWWGIPWGPVWTIQFLVVNLRGGKNLTQQVVASLNKPSAPAKS